jgi:hypothetical protein
MYSSRAQTLGIDPVRTQVESNIAHYYGSDKQRRLTVAGFCVEAITDLTRVCERSACKAEAIFGRPGRYLGVKGRIRPM